MSSDLDVRLAEAVNRAQLAQLNLVGLMAAHGISRRELKVLLAWPAPVKAAYQDLDAALRPVSKLLAERHGEEWQSLSLAKLVSYTQKAYELVMDSPMPDVPHASGVGPIRLN